MNSQVVTPPSAMATEIVDVAINKFKSKSSSKPIRNQYHDSEWIEGYGNNLTFNTSISNSATNEINNEALFAEVKEDHDENAIYPQFADTIPYIPEHQFKIRVAIDFGTDGIGI